MGTTVFSGQALMEEQNRTKYKIKANRKYRCRRTNTLSKTNKSSANNFLVVMNYCNNSVYKGLIHK